MPKKSASVAELIDNPGAIKGGALKPPAKPANSEHPLRDRHVSMSNALTRGAQGLLLTQKRIVSMALAKTNSKLPIDGSVQGGWTIRLTASEYADLYEVSLTSAYEQLKIGTEKLLRTLWTAHLIDDSNKTVRRRGQWLALADYRDSEGMVDITFHPHIVGHLLGLQRQFTSYKLKHATALRSVYAWRMMECLESWKSTGRWVVSVEEFERIMEAPASCKGNFGNLQKRVITPAINELAVKNNLHITMKPVQKKGRKVLIMAFQIEAGPLDPQGKLPI